MINKMEITKISDFIPVIRKILQQKYPLVFVLQGNLGAGKTTFVRTFIEYLDQSVLVTSPTFSLMNKYQINDSIVYHFDLYRLNSSEEAFECGFDEFINNCDFAFIEWAERAMDIVPNPYTLIELEHGSQEHIRYISVNKIIR